MLQVFSSKVRPRAPVRNPTTQLVTKVKAGLVVRAVTRCGKTPLQNTAVASPPRRQLHLAVTSSGVGVGVGVGVSLAGTAAAAARSRRRYGSHRATARTTCRAVTPSSSGRDDESEDKTRKDEGALVAQSVGDDAQQQQKQRGGGGLGGAVAAAVVALGIGAATLATAGAASALEDPAMIEVVADADAFAAVAPSPAVYAAVAITAVAAVVGFVGALRFLPPLRGSGGSKGSKGSGVATARTRGTGASDDTKGRGYLIAPPPLFPLVPAFSRQTYRYEVAGPYTSCDYSYEALQTAAT